MSFNISTPNDVAKQIAARVKARRLELNLTQEGMAARAGLKFATYRRFEQTGEISLKGLLQIGFALNIFGRALGIDQRGVMRIRVFSRMDRLRFFHITVRITFAERCLYRQTTSV